jgi:hypothetical protein
MVLNPTNDHHRLPTKCSAPEFEQSDLDVRIDMTYESPDWDPSDERYAKAETSMINNDGSLRHDGPNRDREVI